MDAMQLVTEGFEQIQFADQAIPVEAQVDHLKEAVRSFGLAVQVLVEHASIPTEASDQPDPIDREEFLGG